MEQSAGKVYLVGAGPGDPALLTLRGQEVLARADVVVYDKLVNEALLRHAPKAESILVGKGPGRHPLDQEDINRLLIDQARRVGCVVRLKGGDPMVFGRGGEEAQALADAGVPFEIVPGVTAALGVAAYGGIPITARGTSGHVTLITGHSKDADAQGPRFDRLHLDGTLVFYMGVENLAANMAALIAAGRAADTPVAVVEWSTLPRQRTVTGTLADIRERCAEAGIGAPSIVVVGEVVDLRGALSWFEDRPLFGRRVVVTRTRERAHDLVALLHERGADVFELPTVEIDAAIDSAPHRAVSEYDWVILASINAVDALFERMARNGQDVRDLHGVKLCAISARAAEALRERFIQVELVPDRYETEFVLDGLERVGGPLKGKTVLMPRADIGRSSLPKALRERGAEVDELQAYRTAVPKDSAALAEEFVRFAPDYITFTSASAARNFHAVVGESRIGKVVSAAQFAAIGPIAAAAARELGMEVAIVPEVHRVTNLVDAIVRYDAASRRGIS